MKLSKYLLILLLSISPVFGQNSTIINITQTPCQFLEFEGKNLNFTSKQESDCNKINQSTLKNRSNDFIAMKLKEGKYIFRVTNKGVPYEVGFYLRGSGFGWTYLPRISGGGLDEGVSKDYAIELKKGTYKVSCPLNPTPDYSIVVE